MTKPTGRPKGHPKKYHTDDEKPRTYSLRVPRDLSAILERYARSHRQSVSELFLDGLRWRLTEGDPRGNGVALPPAGAEPETPYYQNTDDASAVLDELRAVRRLLTETVASGALAAPVAHEGTQTKEANLPLLASGARASVADPAPGRAPYGSVKTRVLAAAQEHAPCTCHELATALGMPNGKVHQALQTLVMQDKLLDKRGTGPRAVYALPRARAGR